MSLNNVKVVKKDGTKEEFNVQKVVVAVNKSAYRALIKFSQKDIDFICHFVEEKVEELGVHEIQIPEMHNIVEGALEKVNPIVAKSYRDYRNYKQDFVQMLDEVYKKSQSIMYIGDKENSNTDSALVSTKRSLIFNELNKELYRKFFMNRDELQACKDGGFTDDELEWARRSVVSTLMTTLDAQSRLEDYWLGQAAAGLTEAPDELAQRVERTTRAQVQAAAQKLTLDTVYFLKGKE